MLEPFRIHPDTDMCDWYAACSISEDCKIALQHVQIMMCDHSEARFHSYQFEPCSDGSRPLSSVYSICASMDMLYFL